MVSTFLSHTWKKFGRSVSFSKELATTIFLAFFALMIGSYLLVLGITLPHIISDNVKQSDPIAFLHSILLYYFIFEFILRYMLQNVPVLDIQPYLHLPVRKSTIINFLLGKSVLNVLNFFILLLFTPFALSTIAEKHGYTTGLCWITGLWLLTLTVHYLVLLYKTQLDDSLWGIISLVFIFGLLGIADYYGWFKLTHISTSLFSFALTGLWFVLVCFLLVVSAYLVNFNLFKGSVYSDEFAKEGSNTLGQGKDFSFLKTLGATGDWINLELKLILRHKRTRTILLLSAIFLLYGIIFYPNPVYTAERPGFLLFIGIFVTGVFMLNYGQYLFSWQANHFDFTLTRPVSLWQYINSKYWLLASITFICFLLTIPYVFFGWRILLINSAMMLFNLGVNVFVVMNMGMWAPKKLDLRKGGAFNIQGVGAAQWMMGLPIFLGPYIFYLPFSISGYPMAGIFAVAFVGLAGIICRPFLITATARRLHKKKHLIAAGFRKD